MHALFTAFICMGGLTLPNTYHIGNSKTLDAHPELFPHTKGYTVRGASTLNTIITNPNWPFNQYLDTAGVEFTGSGDTMDYGNFERATTNFDWDFISLQPYPGAQPNTVSSDTAAFNLIHGLEPGATLILYQGYPDLGNSDPYNPLDPFANTYADKWNSPLIVNGGDPKTENSLAYVTALEDELETQAFDLRVARIGAVLKEIDDQGRASQLGSGIPNAEHFYDPAETEFGRHLTVEGDYIAHATLYHTIYGNLDNLDVSLFSGDAGWDLTPGEVGLLNQIILQVNAFESSSVPEPSGWMLGLLTLGLVGGSRFKKIIVAKFWRKS